MKTIKELRAEYEQKVLNLKADDSVSKDDLEKELSKLREWFNSELSRIINKEASDSSSSHRGDHYKSRVDSLKDLLNAHTNDKSKSASSQVEQQNATVLANIKSSFGKFADSVTAMMNNIFGGGLTHSIPDILLKILNTTGDIADQFNNLFESSINDAINTQINYLGAINGRLYGLTDQLNTEGEDDYNYYSEIWEDLSSKFLNNSFVNQSNLFKKLSDLITNHGIAFNAEERAYISELAENTVTTFNATNSELLRNIRLNQFDLTTSQYGAEGLLTQFFNKNFQDTSYLSDQYQTVYSAISEALSQMNYADATEFNYTVQKWLGSLYSVGASGSMISQLASGINMLATGDVSGLEGSSSLQNLLVMAATKAGLSYSELLTGGLDSSDVDTLMSSMVEYLQEIADNTDNEVVKNAWKSIVGVGVSDLRAIQNLTDTSTISSSTMSFEDALAEAQHQADLYEGANRVSQAERIQNQINNLLYSVGSTLANDTELYTQYRKSQLVTSVVESLSGSLGIVGDLAESVLAPILAIYQNNAITEAFSDVMNKAGYGLTDEDRAEAIEENIGVVAAVTETEDETTVSPVTSTELADAITAAKEAGTIDSLFSDDYLVTLYQSEDALTAALNYATENGFRLSTDQAEIEALGADVGIYGQYTEDSVFSDIDTEEGISHLKALQQLGANWAWVLKDENDVVYRADQELMDGSLVGAQEVSRILENTEAADLEEAATNIATSEATFGWLDMVNMLIQSGWDLIDNGLGLNPFEKTNAYTRRGENLYGIDTSGNITSEIVGTESSLAGYTGETEEASAYSTVTSAAAGLSASYEMLSDTADTTFDTLSRNEAAVSATAQTISSVQEDTTKSLEEIYNALFVEGKMMSVSIQELSAAVTNSFKQIIDDSVAEIKEKLDSTLDVNVTNESTDYFGAVSQMKGW